MSGKEQVIPEWATRLPINLIYKKAGEFNLEPELVAAIIWKESRGFAYAVRFEPHYRWLHQVDTYAKRHRISIETEKNQQQQSFGLCQIMGATARWLGFDGPLGTLYRADQNIYWGCKFIKRLLGKYGNLEDVAAAYNAGTPRRNSDGEYVNQSYVDDIRKYYNELKKT